MLGIFSAPRQTRPWLQQFLTGIDQQQFLPTAFSVSTIQNGVCYVHDFCTRRLGLVIIDSIIWVAVITARLSDAHDGSTLSECRPVPDRQFPTEVAASNHYHVRGEDDVIHSSWLQTASARSTLATIFASHLHRVPGDGHSSDLRRSVGRSSQVIYANQRRSLNVCFVFFVSASADKPPPSLLIPLLLERDHRRSLR